VPDLRRAARLAIVALAMAAPRPAVADETDNFTCRGRALGDAQDALDGWVNSRIGESLERARALGPACGALCLVRDLQLRIGASARHPATLIPHARLALWIDAQPDIDRCRLAFRESIYGARPYNLPWLFPFTGRVILLADSIRLSGRLVGVDKVNHFLREGLEHWHAVQRGDDIAAVLTRELGSPRRPLPTSEHGLKGLALTGVVSYADLAASYSGFTFWSDLLDLSGTGMLAYDAPGARFNVGRRFTFADYVNDAWDEAVNRSSFDPILGREVGAALGRRGVGTADCRALTRLPQAELYLNPACL
jgi:hypothetical protein